jgi:hypothetical protein
VEALHTRKGVTVLFKRREVETAENGVTFYL